MTCGGLIGFAVSIALIGYGAMVFVLFASLTVWAIVIVWQAILDI